MNGNSRAEDGASQVVGYSQTKITYTMSHWVDFPEWPLLIKEYNTLRAQPIQQLFQENHFRAQAFQSNICGINLDYSLQPITEEAIFLLTELMLRHKTKERINDLFLGREVNKSEQKPALHTALRSSKVEVIYAKGENVSEAIHDTLSQMESMAQQIRDGLWLGFKGLPITDVVNIGIGGSDLGPKFAVDALKDYKTTDIRCHFISDCDPDSFDDAVSGLTKATTLFLVASKTFTTKETILNYRKAVNWLGENNAIGEHFIAITANPSRARDLGIQYVLPIWEWVGGRYSFFSAMNFILMIALGGSQFQQLLSGARDMDTHFRTAPFARNMPVLLALLGIWNLNFFGAHNHLLLVYSKRLMHLIAYLQQLDMESNGKTTNTEGALVNYTTGPIVWGGSGNQAEHAFYQLLYQGSHYTPGDFIFLGEKRYETMNQSAFEKLNFLAFGREAHEKPAILYGKVGINKIILDQLSPYTLGALVALYEHKIYCQSVVWNINAFDQPGVEAAKCFTSSEGVLK